MSASEDSNKDWDFSDESEYSEGGNDEGEHRRQEERHDRPHAPRHADKAPRQEQQRDEAMMPTPTQSKKSDLQALVEESDRYDNRRDRGGRRRGDRDGGYRDRGPRGYGGGRGGGMQKELSSYSSMIS